MADIKSPTDIARKWARVTPARTEDYKLGVENPLKDWASETAAAETRYKDGVAKAAARNAFGKGVKKAGTAKWKEGATTMGVRRWGEGVQAGESAYASGFAPYSEVISRTALPPKYPKGDPRNIARVAAVAKALRDAKEASA